MRSSNGGWHGLAGWGFRGLSETGVGLRADDGANPVSDAGSPVVAANLRLAELRSVSEFSGAEGFPLVLAAKARRSVVRCHRRAFQADQARRTARRRRRVPAALRRDSAGWAEPTGRANARPMINSACPPFRAKHWWARLRSAHPTNSKTGRSSVAEPHVAHEIAVWLPVR